MLQISGSAFGASLPRSTPALCRTSLLARPHPRATVSTGSLNDFPQLLVCVSAAWKLRTPWSIADAVSVPLTDATVVFSCAYSSRARFCASHCYNTCLIGPLACSRCAAGAFRHRGLSASPPTQTFPPQQQQGKTHDIRHRANIKCARVLRTSLAGGAWRQLAMFQRLMGSGTLRACNVLQLACKALMCGLRASCAASAAGGSPALNADDESACSRAY